jgi:hypothetical protein
MSILNSKVGKLWFGLMVAVSVSAFTYWLIVELDLLNWNFRSPREWSVLQAAESRYRDVLDAETPAIVSFGEGKNQLNAARFKSSQGARVWVLLDAQSAPLYKRLPEVELSLTFTEFRSIEERAKMSNVVRSELIKRIK